MDKIFPYKKLIGAGSLALGALLIFIASFLKFLSVKVMGDNESYGLKKLSEMADDMDETKFNPHALLIIFAILGIVAAVGIFIGNSIMPGLDKICLLAGAVIGLVIFIIILVYGSSGAMGDVKDLAETFGKAKVGPGYVLTIIGSLIMILGAAFSFVLEILAPSNSQPQQF